MGFDHGAGGATGTAGAGGATGTAPRLRLGILGTGYLGATHAVCMSELGFDVLGMDVDDGKIARLAAGEVPFYEPGLEPLLRKSLDSGRLRFTTSYAEVAAFADVQFLCVGTPQKDGEYAADLSAVDAAIDGLLPLLSRPCLLVGKSTVPAGTADRLAARVAAEAPTVELAWNPEFLREGFAITDTMRPDRLVFGVASAAAEATCGRSTPRPSRPGRRWSAVTSPPPSWSRWPPTPSSPRRSASSTPWPRFARRPGRT